MSGQDRHFDINASIVFQLGEGLISDSVQALVELIKNCWDADSTYARITVGSKGAPPDHESLFQGDGYLLVEDDGVGMGEEELIKGWLTISNSMKREHKAKKLKTQRHRTPLGEKGLGRLGVQRLGENIEIITERAHAAHRYHVGWSWNDFQGKRLLSELSPTWKQLAPTGKPGTTLVITGLRDRESWEQQDTLERFKLRLSQMISPYANLPQFKIRGRINNRPLELAEISDKLRTLATLRYRVDFDGDALDVSGRMRLEYLRPAMRRTAAAEEQRDFEELVAEDGGEALAAFLASKPSASRFTFTRDSARGWFCRVRGVSRLAELDKVVLTLGTPATPGPFHAEVDNFDLGSREYGSDPAGQGRGAFESEQEYRQYVKNFGGIRVFRDGFGVRTDEDWLGLGKAFTGGGSFYALRPANVMGFVALTAEHNQALVEATDREGFIDTPAYQNFLLLFRGFARFAGEAQEFVRRGYNDFRAERARRSAALPATALPDEVARTLVRTLARAQPLQQQMKELEHDVVTPAARDATSIQAALRRAPTPAQVEVCLAKVTDLHKSLGVAAARLRDVQAELHELSKLTAQATLLQHQVDILQHQMQQMASTVALGLTAEALSHEIANVADRLAEKTTDVARYLNRARTLDERVLAYVEHVRETVSALRKQLSHLAPSLRFARETRHSFTIKSFLEELSAYHNERWRRTSPIQMIVKGDGGSFNVRMNRGKLTQVIDNLVLNSEYWVKEHLRTGRIERGVITARYARPHLHISDNGPGIDPDAEATLFQPFHSKKTKNGRGLGLYIARQLLNADNCSIEVSAKRNQTQRLFQFQIDLSGVLDGDV